MQWPADHPALTDPALRPWADRVDDLRGDLEVVRVLRHLAGRRVTSQVRTADGDAVLKMFASPRARGNDRRLRRWKQSGVAPIVPAPLGADVTGHIGLVEFVPGTPLDRLDGAEFVAAIEMAGDALRRLHTSGVELDRSWTIDEERGQLERRSTERAAAAVSALLAMPEPHVTALVSAHRDCHTAQAVVHDGRLCWIDLDDAAMAPAALDLGNLSAHLRRDAVIGTRPPHLVESAVAALRSGYGADLDDLHHWECLSLARLACLAEVRHGRPDWADALLDLLGTLTDGATLHAPAARTAPGPHEALDPVDRVHGALADLGLASPVELPSVAATARDVGRHADRPVFRVATSRGDAAAKVLADGRTASPARDLEALWASPFGAARQPPGLARPLGWSPTHRVLVSEWIDGPSLDTPAGAALTSTAQVAQLLFDLHHSGVRHRRVQDVESIMRSVHRKVAELGDDALRAAAAHLADDLARHLPDDAVLVPSHGDYAPPNIVCTPAGPRLIDLDRLQLSDPARDLAYYGAWHWATALLAGRPPTWSIGDELLAAYSSLDHRRIDDSTRRFHRAAALVRVAHGWSAFRKSPASAAALLDEARRVLAR